MLLFENGSTSAAFWFAAEEYIMRFLRPREPALMLWTTGETIMIGANQIAGAECDVARARSAGIEIVRRRSGGGAIFTDGGALQYTVILPFGENDEPGDIVRSRLAVPVTAALARCGVRASLEGRNDIMVGGKKVSGVAQYILDGYICSHGSLLFGTDLEKLERYLVAKREKYATKAIASARARVANISGLAPGTDMQTFRELLAETCAAGEPRQGGGIRRQEFGGRAADQIETIMRERYMNPEWTFGREPAFTFTNSRRFPGGQLEVFLDVKGGIIQEAKIRGDFLSLLPLAELETKLTGVPHREDALEDALGQIDVKAFLGSLAACDLLETLL